MGATESARRDGSCFLLLGEVLMRQLALEANWRRRGAGKAAAASARTEGIVSIDERCVMVARRGGVSQRKDGGEEERGGCLFGMIGMRLTTASRSSSA
jgi:hypothetical protein